MNNQTDTVETEDKALTTGVALYPSQIAIVRELAARERRSFSNALQVIIEQWAESEKTQAHPIRT